jgi:hypothetical protein
MSCAARCASGQASIAAFDVHATAAVVEGTARVVDVEVDVDLGADVGIDVGIDEETVPTEVPGAASRPA